MHRRTDRQNYDPLDRASMASSCGNIYIQQKLELWHCALQLKSQFQFLLLSMYECKTFTYSRFFCVNCSSTGIIGAQRVPLCSGHDTMIASNRRYCDRLPTRRIPTRSSSSKGQLVHCDMQQHLHLDGCTVMDHTHGNF